MRGAGLFIVLGGVAVALGFMGFYDNLGITSGDVQEGVGTGADKAISGWDKLVAQSWGYTAIGAGLLASLGFMTWKRIGGWGRGAVLVLAGIAVGAVLLKISS